MIDESDVKDKYELYNRIKNPKRKKLLSYIYEKPRSYRELADFTRMKPGSLYHHLNVLHPLIIKSDHGLYEITKLGRDIASGFNIVKLDDLKPNVMKSEQQTNEITILQKKTAINKKSNTDVNQNLIVSNYASDRLELIWLAPSSYFIILIISLITLFLGQHGVTLAGSAIYAVGEYYPYGFDILALVIGLSVLYVTETFDQYSISNRVKYIFTIRLISMLPAAIVGLNLFLLFSLGLHPSQFAYNLIFIITVFIGVIFTTSGVFYLRARPLKDSIIIGCFVGLFDLVIGFVVLISI